MTPGQAFIVTRRVAQHQPKQAVSAAAYVLTRAAAERLHAGVVPIHCDADSWGLFLKEGLLEHLWCVLPRPVKTETSLSSIIDYVAADSRTGRIKRLAAKPGATPIRWVLHGVRSTRERRMSRFVIDEHRQ